MVLTICPHYLNVRLLQSWIFDIWYNLVEYASFKDTVHYTNKFAMIIIIL